VNDHAFVLFRSSCRVRGCRSALALLALAPFAASAQDDSAVLQWQHDDKANVAEFRIYYGRAPQSLSGVKLVLDPAARTATVDGLDDGTWYFAVVAVSPNAAESEPSNLLCVVIPSGPCKVPLDEEPRPNSTATVLQAPSIRVSISNVHRDNGGFDLSIEGSGTVMIELADALQFDWCSPAGASSLPAVTPTTPSLGDKDDDGNQRRTVTFTAPVAHTRCDGDVAAGSRRAFSGATVTVQGVSKPLVESSGSWSAQFP
jgi:hypothetical protein